MDTAFNYKTIGKVSRYLPEVAGNGFNVYFDNVGGDHLEAALFNMADFGQGGAVRNDRPVQRPHPAERPKIPHRHHPQATHPPGVHRLRPPGASRRLHRRDGRVDPGAGA